MTGGRSAGWCRGGGWWWALAMVLVAAHRGRAGDPSAAAREDREEGCAASPVIEIEARRPHHTRHGLGPPPDGAGAVVECRIHLAEWSGAPPAVYLYAMRTGGFAYARLTPAHVAVGWWPSPRGEGASAGTAAAPNWTGGWARVRFAYAADVIAASVWPEDGPEPPSWQVYGAGDVGVVTGLAAGVWLPPESDSRATVWIENVRIRAPAPADGLDVLVPANLPIEWPPKAPGPLVTPTGGCVAVVGGDLAVAVDRRSGRWLRLTHRGSGLEFLDPHSREPLFRFSCVEWPGGPSRTYGATDFRRLEWRTEGAEAIEAVFGDGPAEVTEARVRFETMGDEGILIRCAVAGPSARVSRVECPILPISPALGGDSSDDRLLIPHSHTDGILVREPGARDRNLGGRHPGDAAVQMMAVYDGAGGLLTAARDTRGEVKELRAVTRAGRSFTLVWAHDRPQVPGEGEVPYAVWLGAFRGDWRDAADLYKRWARRQFWCARKLTERDDIPACLKEGAAGVIYGIANEEGYNGIFGPGLERVPEVAREWRERLGVPHVIIVPYGWERRGTWAGINYFPAVPSDEAWAEANRRLAAEGNSSLFLTSGFWWVVRRAATRNGPAFDDTAEFERRRGMVIAAPDGSPWFVDNYGKVGTHGDWRGWSVALCHGCAVARGTMKEIFLRVAALGVPMISFDQDIGGRQAAPCYSAQHDHPPGWGAWMWSDFTNLCGGILRAAKAEGRTIGLLTENCGEMLIPVMASFWSRQFGVVDHATPGDETVGLFSYLYHEYVTAIAAAMVQGQGPRQAVPSPGLRAQAMAHALVRGLIPCPFAMLVPMDPPSGTRPPMAEAFVGFAPAYGRFPEFLVLGETLRPPPVMCERRDEQYTLRGDRPGAGSRRITVPLPNVVAGRFRAPSGAVATVLANPTAAEQTAEVEPFEAGRPATLCGGDGQVVEEWAELPARCRVTLPPYSCRLLVVPATSSP